MPLWSLTLERKNELLKKRDDKIKELKSLQAKSPALLWREDLDAFLEKVFIPLLLPPLRFLLEFQGISRKKKKFLFYLIFQLDEIEQKEKEEEMGNDKMSKEKKGKGKMGKLKLTAAETMPSPVGRRVVPKINEEDRKKLEKLDQAARNAKDGIKKEKKKVVYFARGGGGEGKLVTKKNNDVCLNLEKGCDVRSRRSRQADKSSDEKRFARRKIRFIT